MKCLRIVILLNLLCASLACSQGTEEVGSYFGISIATSTLNDYIQTRMDDLDIPGLSIAVVNSGNVVYQETFGYADVEEGRPVTDETIFEGASLSKPVFAFFVMTFVEEGTLDLDRPLYELYPYPDIAHNERYKEITARMVLSHQAGFPNWRDPVDGPLELHFDPGTGYRYSGEGYQYLALVLREIEQTDWAGLEALFQERVAQPLGLEHTAFIETPHIRANKAKPYSRSGTLRLDHEDNNWFRKYKDVFVAAGSIRSEPKDFSKWMLAVMDEEVLTEESYAEMLRPHAETAPIQEGGIFYTLGFQTVGFPLSSLYMHGGDNTGFDAFLALDTRKDWGFVMFANSDNGQAFGQELLFWLMTGPNQTAFLVVVGILALVLLIAIIAGVVIGVRRLTRKLRGPHPVS